MINQRILYVGIGGSGIDLGLELDSALKRDICGIDGSAVKQKGLDYAPNVLPKFVQQVYIDFEAAALNNAAQRLRGSNVRTVTNVIPPSANNFKDVADYLRMYCSELVDDWLPETSHLQPNVNPLSAGAGQYPTVGRAALFESIRAQGLENVLTTPIRSAIAELSGSLGELNTCIPGCLDSVTVYVGFSISGGTGCGLFYDVLMVLLKELEILKEDVYVFPTVLCPSTFNGVLQDQYMNRAKLNAATAIVDLVGMVGQMMDEDRTLDKEFSVTYPGALKTEVSLGSPLSKIHLPAISTVSLSPGMKREDSVRILASAIVTQASMSGDVAGGGPKSFGGYVVNVQNDIKVANPHSVLARPLMPMLSASLTVPSKKIAEIIAKRLLQEADQETNGVVQQTSNDVDNELADEILRYSGLAKLIDGDVFADSYNLSFTPPKDKKQTNSRQKLDQRLQTLQNRVDTVAVPVVREKIASNIRVMVSFDLLSGMEAVLERRPDVSMTAIIRAGQAALTKLGTIYENPTAVNGRATGGKPKRIWIKTKPKRAEIERLYSAIESDFKKKVDRMWWQQWSDARFQWITAHENSTARLSDLSSWWRELVGRAGQSAQEEQSALMQAREGVRDFIPTGGVPMEQAFENIYASAREDIQRQNKIAMRSVSGLVQHVLGSKGEMGITPLQNALSVFRQSQNRHDFTEAIINPLKSAVNSTFTGPKPAFSSMEALLKDMVSHVPSADGVQLKTEIASLVPAVLIPPGESHKVKIVVTYPGQPDPLITRTVKNLVCQSNAIKTLIGIGQGQDAADIEVPKSLLDVQAVGDSDTLTININKVGQGIFENPELCGVFASWKAEIKKPMTDKVAWRQRRGPAKSHQIITGQARIHMLNRLMLAWWDGRLAVRSGSVELPEVMILRTKTGDNNQMPEIRLGRSTTGSGWSSLVSGVEDLMINQNGVVTKTSHVLKQALEIMPDMTWLSDDPTLVDIPPHVQDLLRVRLHEISRLTANLGIKDLTAAQSMAVSVERDFWLKDLAAAWRLPITEAGVSLNTFVSLD